MPTLIFIEHNGHTREVEAAIGTSVMEAAVASGVDGILAECGGSCSCATCHVYVDPAWVRKLPPPEDLELGTLDGVREPRDHSRLSCQITVDSTMEGATFHVPERQF